MSKLKAWIVKAWIGKNAPSYGRAVTQVLAGLILTSFLFTGDVDLTTGLDADIAPEFQGAAELVAISRAEVEDGLTFEELAKLLAMAVLAWATRVVSWLRAKNLDGLARVFGWLIGRSIWSFVRFLLEMAAGAMLYFGIMPEASPDLVAALPVDQFLSALILFVSARLLSGAEDSGRNQIPLPELVTPSTLPPVR